MRAVFSEAQKAEALAVLKANGGNLARTAREVGVAASTIAGWRDAPERAAPTEVRDQKEEELASLFNKEIRSIFGALGTKRSEASYRDLVVGLGVCTEKHLLVSGQPTEHLKHSGTIDADHALDLLRQAYRTSGEVQ